MRGVHRSLYKPFHFSLSGMLWSGYFVAKGEKGDCVALQEEGTSVYTRFTSSSGFGVVGSSLVVFWAAVLFPTIVTKVSLYHCHVFFLHAEIIDRPSY